MKIKGQNTQFAQNADLWLVVKRDIETKVITGEYEAGSKIPTIVELVDKYGIGKTTAQKIINALYDEGTIVKKVKLGCFVKPFVKDRLYEQHKKELGKQIDEVVGEALLLGINRDCVLKLFNKTWDKINNTKKAPPK